MAALVATALVLALAPAAFGDPLDTPAPLSRLAPRSPLAAVTAAGSRLVAVGQRGHVLWSDDGARWTQAAVPVSTDLTAVFFPTAERGWAVGHDCVVLASADGGRTWAKQLDGRDLGGLPAPALLDVWFADERTGFAVGAFNLVLATADGGAIWTPFTGRTDNPRGLHLHAIARVGGDVWIVGEQGLVLRLDAASRRFRAIPLPHRGSLFGIAGNGETVVAYGLGGSAFRTRDRGASWERVHTGVDASLVGAAELPDGSIALVTQGGEVLVCGDGGSRFRLATPPGAAPLATAAAVAGPGSLVLVGAAGVRVVPLR